VAFRPKVNDALTICERTYRIAEHPAAPGMAYGQTGRRGTVYQLIDQEGNEWALKVFLRQYREPRLVGQTERIRDFASLPGLRVSEREVLTSIQHVDLIREHMELAYAVLMPWIPGKTWLEIVVGREEWSADQSLTMVKSFLHILARLEERGIAHCDLSGPNLILTPEGQVELVDLEEMYATDLRRPIALPGGSPGYAHKTAPEGLWQPEADRFAGAILIAEMLSWCDARVKDAAWGEGYFEPGEMQTNGERYHLLKGVQQERWGDRLGELFEAAWFSDTLSLCPTFTEWLAALPEEVPEYVPEADREPEPETEIEDVGLLILQAERASGKGEIDEALSLLKRAERQATGKLLVEIRARVAELEGVEASEEDVEKEEGWRCSECERMVPDEADLCPYCEHGKRPGMEEGVAWEAGLFEEAIAFEGKEPSEVQFNELEPHAQESTQIRQEKERITSEPFPIKVMCIWGAFVVIIIAAFLGYSRILGSKEMSTELPPRTEVPSTEVPPTRVPQRKIDMSIIYEYPYAGIPPQGALARFGKGTATNVDFSADGSRLIVGGGLGILSYDPITLELMRIDETTGSVGDIAVSPDNKTVVVSLANAVQLWDVDGKGLLESLEADFTYIYSMALSPDGLVAIGTYPDVQIWDLYSHQLLYTLEGHTSTIDSMAFSPDGSLLASGSQDDTVKIWEVSTGDLLHTLEGHNWVFGVVFSPDGSILATGDVDDRIRIWDVATGQLIKTLTEHTDTVYSVAFSPDGSLLASGARDETVRLWDVTNWKQLEVFDDPTGSITSVAFSPDGSLLAAGSWEDTAHLWNVKDRVHLGGIEGHTSSVTAVDISPDGRLVATGTRDCSVQIWEVSSGKLLETLEGDKVIGYVYGVAFSPDGTLIAYGTSKKVLKVRNLNSGQLLYSFAPTGGVRNVTFSPDGSILASSSSENSVQLWEVNSGDLLGILDTLDYIQDIAFSPNGAKMAIASYDIGIEIWDMSSLQRSFTIEGVAEYAEVVAFSPDGNILASATYESILLWDVNSVQLIETIDLIDKYPDGLAYSPDGSKLVLASLNELIIYDTSNWEVITTLTGHGGYITGIAFSSDGSIIASGSGDGTVILWDASTW
jgi:WD40 repeat protein